MMILLPYIALPHFFSKKMGIMLQKGEQGAKWIIPESAGN
jgi:hypothetical protein